MVGDDVEDTMAPPYATMSKEFVDVPQPLPSELPPKWEMTHNFPFEPDGKPPSRPIYRVVPLELLEGKM